MLSGTVGRECIEHRGGNVGYQGFYKVREGLCLFLLTVILHFSQQKLEFEILDLHNLP